MKHSFLKKTCVLGLAALTAFGCVACGGGNGGDDNANKFNKPGKDKTVIKVANFQGGVGSVWIDEAAERFAEANQETHYADGKTGVYIDIQKTQTISVDALEGSTTNIIFHERYADINALAQTGALLSLDEIVKDETRIGGSLESKIFPEAKGGLMGNNGSYYGLPHYEFFGGLSYNCDIFDRIFAYIADSADEGVLYSSEKFGDAYFVNSLDSKKSAGPDGEYNTADDGFPVSCEEFLILLDYIKYNNVSPLILAGDHATYADYLICGLWPSLAGAEQMRNYYNCTGEIEVVDRNEDGSVKLTNENIFPGIDYIKKPATKTVIMKDDGSQGYYGNDMVAKYYALAMLKIMENEDFFSPDASIGTRTHYDAQMNLYMQGIGEYDEVAILIEGSYWYNESKEGGCFDKYERWTGNSRNDLNLAWMPLPTNYYTEGAIGRSYSLLDIGQAYGMVNGNIKNNKELKDACLDFMAFLYSEDELENFTVCTGMTRMVNYSLDDTQKAQLSKFYKSLWELRDNVNGSNIVALSGTTDTFKQAKTGIKLMLNSPVLRVDVSVLERIQRGESIDDIIDTLGFTASSWLWGAK